MASSSSGVGEDRHDVDDPLGMVQAFRSFSLDDRAAVTRALRVRKLHRGELLFPEGEQGTSLFIIAEGELRASLASGKTLRTMGPGQFVGEMACIDPAPRSVSVSAVSETTVYELDRSALLALRLEAPHAARGIVDNVLRTVTARLRELDGRIAADLGEPGPVLPLSPSKGQDERSAPPDGSNVASPEAPPEEPASRAKGTSLRRLVGWLRGSE